MSRKITIEYNKKRQTISVPTEGDWDRVVKKILPMLKAGSVLAISGPLGAGKTTFVQTLAKELGSKKRPSSPTFALLRAYTLPRDGAIRRLVHLDAYRLEKKEDLFALDLEEELVMPGTVLAIEWPEKIEDWLKNTDPIRIRIAV